MRSQLADTALQAIHLVDTLRIDSQKERDILLLHGIGLGDIAIQLAQLAVNLLQALVVLDQIAVGLLKLLLCTIEFLTLQTLHKVNNDQHHQQHQNHRQEDIYQVALVLLLGTIGRLDRRQNRGHLPHTRLGIIGKCKIQRRTAQTESARHIAIDEQLDRQLVECHIVANRQTHFAQRCDSGKVQLFVDIVLLLIEFRKIIGHDRLLLALGSIIVHHLDQNALGLIQLAPFEELAHSQNSILKRVDRQNLQQAVAIILQSFGCHTLGRLIFGLDKQLFVQTILSPIILVEQALVEGHGIELDIEDIVGIEIVARCGVHSTEVD